MPAAVVAFERIATACVAFGLLWAPPFPLPSKSEIALSLPALAGQEPSPTTGQETRVYLVTVYEAENISEDKAYSLAEKFVEELPNSFRAKAQVEIVDKKFRGVEDCGKYENCEVVGLAEEQEGTKIVVKARNKLLPVLHGQQHAKLQDNPFGCTLGSRMTLDECRVQARWDIGDSLGQHDTVWHAAKKGGP